MRAIWGIYLKIEKQKSKIVWARYAAYIPKNRKLMCEIVVARYTANIPRN